MKLIDFAGEINAHFHRVLDDFHFGKQRDNSVEYLDCCVFPNSNSEQENDNERVDAEADENKRHKSLACQFIAELPETDDKREY